METLLNSLPVQNQNPTFGIQDNQTCPSSSCFKTASGSFWEGIKARVEAKVKASRKLFDEKAKIYRDKYGEWLSDEDVRKFILAEDDAEICAECQGYPCQKLFADYQRLAKVHPESETVYLEVKPCKYFLALQNRKRIDRNFAKCQIPPKYVGKDFDSYEVTEFNELAVRGAKWSIKTLNSLLLYGSPGVGKTHLAAIIAQELLKLGKSVIFGDVPSILDAMKATFGNSEKQASLEDVMKSLEEVDMLILDDIGAENPTEWAAERLYLVINSRYNAGKPVVATSNFNATELVGRLRTKDKNGRIIESDITGQRIVSRLTEMCKAVKIGGEDHRVSGFKTVNSKEVK